MSKKVKNKSISDEISSLFTRKSLAESDSDEGELNLADSVEVEGETQVGGIHKQNAPLLEEISSRYKGIPSSRDLDSDSSPEEDLEDSEDEEEEEIEDEEDFSDEENKDSEEEPSADEQEPQEEAPESITLISQKPQGSASKGVCVKNQLKVWENLLEVRIRSQSLMTLSNRLPFPEIFTRCQVASEDFSSQVNEVQENLTSTLNKLIETQNCLLANFPDTRDSLKRGLYSPASLEMEDDDEEPAMKTPRLELSSNSSFDSFRELYRSVIGKWSEKIDSNNKAKPSVNPLKQIDDVLAGKDDLVKSSRLCRGNYELFRESEGEIDEESGKKISPEIYDDTDFYHEILSELIEAKTSQNLNPTASSQKKAKNYVKKVVDTKASKGRRIRFVVHKKMVNFMAPNPYSSWSDEAKDELFSSIFGAGHPGH